MPAIVVAVFLVAHGLVHASFISPAPPARPGAPKWPFDLAHSWLLTPLGFDPSVTRAIGVALLALVLIGDVAAALAAAGILPAPWFVPGIVGGSLASIAMLALFFHPWLLLGFVIDAILVWAVLANNWRPGATGI